MKPLDLAVLRCLSLLLACLLQSLTPVQSSAQSPRNKPKFLATNLKSFSIPFRINADDDSFIEVQLYASSDQGRNWRFIERQSTDKNEFPFQADGDGDYWFAIKTLNRNRQLIPEGKPVPELILQVDTVLPDLSFDVQADAAGRIECRWKADDKNLKSDSIKIAYQPIGADPENWTSVPVNLNGLVRNGSYADQLAWWPETTERSLNVRLSIADQAGNTVFKERRINVTPSPWRHRNQSTAHVGRSPSQNQSTPLQRQTPPPTGENSSQLPTPNLNFGPAPSANDSLTQNQQGTGVITNRPGYHCENGVCVPLAASKPATDSQGARSPADPLRVAGGTQHGHQVPQRDSNPVNHEPAQAEAAAAAKKDLYGSTPDRVAAQFTPPYQPSPSQSAVSWESETERWTRQNQTSSSTVRSPAVNPQIAPAQPNRQIDNPNLPNPNPNQITQSPQHIIGESTTQSPNQYRGLPEQTKPIPAPEFLINDEAANWIGEEDSGSVGRRSANPVTGAQQPSIPANAAAPAVSPTDSTSAPPLNAPEANAAPPLQTSQSMNPASYRRDDPPAESVVEGTGAAGSDETAYDSSVQMIASKRFRLNYAIDAIDPSGVARVDLWMTRDGGATWKSWGSDPDNQSPFPVEVDEEGRYGFRIVIHSQDGLTGRGPSRGDNPDINVQVDTQAPLTQIVSVPYGRAAEAGRLIVNFRVSDPHLTLRPISLFYSTNPQGPWTPIEEGLRNDGRYVWKPTANVPDRVFLRLDALDRAGNRGTHSLTQAIDISGLVPRGTIQGVVPVDQQ